MIAEMKSVSPKAMMTDLLISSAAKIDFYSTVYFSTVATQYKGPFGKYVHDTLSYIVLVVLHYLECLSPPTIAFSNLEWLILIFFAGRPLVECQQLLHIRERIKKRQKKENAGGRLEWVHLKTLSIYLRYIVILHKGSVIMLTVIYTL